MKRVLAVTAGVLSLFFLASLAQSATVHLYVDTAPNAYGSPDWAPWWSSTKADVSAGSFINMRSGAMPGHQWMLPQEEIVYSTMDLGRRLHWIYWIPGESTSALAGRFEVRWVVDWDGIEYTYDWNSYTLIEATPDNGWYEPSNRWEDYNNGVIGTFGFAWWAYDDLADPKDTDGNPWNEVDKADIDALVDIVFRHQTFARGEVRIRDSANADWQVSRLETQVVPEPGTMILLGSGLVGVAGIARRRRGRSRTRS